MSRQLIDTEEGRKRLQRALLDNGFDVGPDGADGYLGGDTAKAIINARIAYKLDRQDQALVDIDLERELGLLTIQDPAVQAAGKLVLPQLFNNISAILAVISALKGKTMSSDQIGGLVRAILTFLAGLAVAKGWVDNATALTIVGGLVTIATAAWSIFTNRPSKIASN